jgi:3-methyladenine DNA glycosylase/8-oxoguanine DNA glycosylase
LAIPGIGPWTVQYTAFRRGHPDVFLTGDLGVKNALKKLAMKDENHPAVDADTVSPWAATRHCYCGKASLLMSATMLEMTMPKI